MGGKSSVGEQMSAIRPSNKLMETKFGDNWLVEQVIELQLKVQGEACSRSKREEIRKAPREELESFIEREGRKLNELAQRARIGRLREEITQSLRETAEFAECRGDD